MQYSILFTGHMIDAKNRAEPRFPVYKEEAAKLEIKQFLLKENDGITYPKKGIAGGACGGDILFHEICMELNIPSEIYLALPQDEFKKTSVSFAGKDWENRFNKLVAQLPVFILPEEKDSESNVWERANNWMLDAALANGGKNMALVALWDGKKGDGGGGTEHLVNITKQLGGNVEIIDVNKI